MVTNKSIKITKGNNKQSCLWKMSNSGLFAFEMVYVFTCDKCLISKSLITFKKVERKNKNIFKKYLKI